MPPQFLPQRPILVLHNTGAGSGATSGADLVAAFRDAGFTVRYRNEDAGLPPAGELTGLGAVVIAGGDGTVARALVALAPVGIPCAIVPLGGANNVAASLGVPTSLREAAEGLRRGRIRPFRLWLAEDGHHSRVFVEAAGCGAIAESLSRADDGNGHLHGIGKIRAGQSLLIDALRDARPIRSRVRVDGVPLPEDVLFVEALNVSPTGPCLPLAPASEPGGEALHVAVLLAGQREAFMDALARGRPLPVDIIRGSRIEIAWRDDALRIDDAPMRAPGPMRMVRITPSDMVARLAVPDPAAHETEDSS